MAALVAGVQYGLSSHSNFPENKSLIFVKLTDSAQRAIEDFLRNGSTTNQNPTIQFLGNEGQLSFPSTQSSHGSAGFTFSLSGNQDIEGPQGGFECIQQTGPKSLESLGTLPWKMRIQANDDVYETTRHRMAVAEENNKNKCTRVIKANGPDIGRKVKVKAVGRTIPPPMTNTQRHRESTSIPTSSNQSSRPLAPVQPPVSSTTLTSSSSSTYKPIKSSNPPSARQHEKKCSDIMRRPLRERLIHLLALRPYKRPELYDRINKEGIKERDRSTTTTLLKQVACMKDNTYHLHRHVWNDVQEDWPFYTEQEKAMLKRRKPQNLTPPGSSDGGSSGSGQSPNSTHPGSPPAISAPPPGLMSHKRPGYYQSADGLQTKRPRISHFRKSDTGGNNNNNNNNNHSNNSNSRGENARTTGGSLGPIGSGSASSSASVVSSGSALVNGSAGSEINGWDHRQQHQQQPQPPQQQQQQQQPQQQQQQQLQQQRDRGDWRTERTTTSSEVLRNYGSTKSCLTPTSDNEDNGAMTSSNPASSLSNVSSNNLGSNHHSHNNNSSSNHYHNHNYNNHSSVNSTSKSSLVNDNNYSRIEFVRSLSSSAATSSANPPNPTTTNATTTTNGPVERRDERQSSSVTNNPSSASSSSSSSRSNERDRERERSHRERSNPLSDNSANNPQNNVHNNIHNLPSSKFNPNSANPNQSQPNKSSASSAPTNNYSPTSPTISSTSKNSEFPDYHTYFTTISSTEQRRRYKDEFNSDYEEYRRLHAQVAKVSKRFAQLEEKRRKELENGNRGKIEEIEVQIWREYNDTKRDPVHKEAKKRFDYLHEKLSHLKRLVHEYDMKNSAGNGQTDKILTVRNGVVDSENSANLRY